MNLKDKEKEFNALKNDVEKWKWIKQNSDSGAVFLDNDDTFAMFDSGGYGSPVLEFDYYLGGGEGVIHLLKSVGIKSRGV